MIIAVKESLVAEETVANGSSSAATGTKETDGNKMSAANETAVNGSSSAAAAYKTPVADTSGASEAAEKVTENDSSNPAAGTIY